MNPGRGSGASGASSYTLDMVVQITGVPRRTLFEYCEHGVLALAPGELEAAAFDDDLVCAIRRITQLQGQHGVNLAGIRIINALLAEVERLQRELRFTRDAG